MSKFVVRRQLRRYSEFTTPPTFQSPRLGKQPRPGLVAQVIGKVDAPTFPVSTGDFDPNLSTSRMRERRHRGSRKDDTGCL